MLKIVFKLFIIVAVCVFGYSCGAHFAPSLFRPVVTEYPVLWIHAALAILGFATYKVMK